jgi:hypothetical protein
MKNYIVEKLIMITLSLMYTSGQQNTVIIRLNNNAFVKNKIVYLDDISTINGSLYDKKIDIAQFSPDQILINITKEQILFRLKLYNPHYEYVILGPSSIKVYFTDSKPQGIKYIVPGQKLTLIYKFNNLEVKTIAEAIERGKVGDIIKFRNIESQKIIYGKIVDEKTAIIE